jgi:hypothetical protein
VEYPTRPQNPIEQMAATTTAIVREIAGPEYHIKNRWVSWLSPPSLGRSIIILIYWAVILYILLHDAVHFDAYYYERMGFRAAWISVTQVPFIYLLASKTSIVGFLVGTSHERLNFLHRWVSRTLLVTATLHGWSFYAEWYAADFVELELQVMPMVKYGFGAWGILLWTTLSSLTPIRRLSYEIFVLQHIAAAAVLLWLLWAHVPAYAMYNIWFSIAVISFDKIFLWGWTAWNNFSLPKPSKAGSELAPGKTKIIGHHAAIRVIDNEYTEVLIHDVKFSWSAGQHIYLRLPTLLSPNPFESHPFTISNAFNNPAEPSSRSIQLIIEAKGGMTRRLHNRALKSPSGFGTTALVTGPFGRPPKWTSYETLVLISAAGGASFIVPVLESVLYANGISCVRRIDVLMIVRQRASIQFWVPRLEDAVLAAENAGIALKIRIAVTCERCGCCGAICNCDDGDVLEDDEEPIQGCEGSLPIDEKEQNLAEVDAIAIEGLPNLAGSPEDEKKDLSATVIALPASSSSSLAKDLKTWKTKSTTSSQSARRKKIKIVFTSARPHVKEFIRRPLEASGGETMVSVCGGKSLVACTRNAVAGLSDERGVHKGTGAQGVGCWVEEYCF